MKWKENGRTSIWMTIWGWMDLAAVVKYVAIEIYRNRTPIIDDILSSHYIYRIHGSSLALITSYASVILLASFIVSGFYLLRHKGVGRSLAVAQLPFRVFLFMPSLLFLDLAHLKGLSPWVVILALVVSEIFKMWSIKSKPGDRFHE